MLEGGGQKKANEPRICEGEKKVRIPANFAISGGVHFWDTVQFLDMSTFETLSTFWTWQFLPT